MKKIEVISRFTIDGQMYQPSEVRIVTDDIAETACKHGWAKDVEGKLPTGVFDLEPKKLDVQNVKVGQSSKVAAGEKDKHG